jgi:hypothetical protein
MPIKTCDMAILGASVTLLSLTAAQAGGIQSSETIDAMTAEWLGPIRQR